MAKGRTSRKTADETETTEAAEAEALEATDTETPDAPGLDDATTETSEALSTPSDQDAVLNARIAELEARAVALAAKEAELAERSDALNARAKQQGSPMLTTANMPGGSMPANPTSALVGTNHADKAPVRRYRGNELGKCRHTVYSAKGHRHAEYSLTLEPSVVYHLVIADGSAQVPDRVADYIRQHNPGNALRMG